MSDNLTPEVLGERIQNLKDEISDVKNESVRTNSRMDKIESNINTIERTLSDKMLVLETTYKLNTEQIKDEIKDLGKQIATLINKEEKKNETQQSRNYDWLKGLGLVVGTILINYIFRKLGF